MCRYAIKDKSLLQKFLTKSSVDKNDGSQINKLY